MRDLYLRLIAYEPGGDRLGLLPEPSSFTWGDVAGEASTLTLTYAESAANSIYLANPCEVAVEYQVNSNWIEARNGRCYYLGKNGDRAAEDGVVTYNMPGLANMLGQATVYVSPTQLGKYGKRPFATQTPGAMLVAVIQEAQGRGAIPWLSYNFSAALTTAGVSWRNEAANFAFDPGTSVLDILNALRDARLIEWYMRGRELVVGNGSGELTDIRYISPNLSLTTSVDAHTWLGTLANNLSEDIPASFGLTSAPGAKTATSSLVTNHAWAMMALAGRGYPHPEWIPKTSLITGTDGTTSRPVAMMCASQLATDLPARPLGAVLIDQNWTTKNMLAISETDANTLEIGWGTFTRTNGCALIVNESALDVGAHTDARSGYMAKCLKLEGGINSVELMSFQDNDDFPYDIIIQKIEGFPSTMANKVYDAMVAQGFRVRKDYGSLAISITDGDRTPPPVPSAPKMGKVLVNGVYRPRITWDGGFKDNAARPSDFYTVMIHRGSDAGFQPTDSTWLNHNLNGAGSFVDTDADLGTNYYYKLVAVDQTRNWSQGTAAAHSYVVRNTSGKTVTWGFSMADGAANGATGTATINGKETPDDLVMNASKMPMQTLAKARGWSNHARVRVASSSLNLPANRGKVATALASVFDAYGPTTYGIPQGGPKPLPDPPATGDTITTDARPIGPVSFIVGNNLVQDNYSTSMEKVSGRVFAYGESFLQLTMDNLYDLTEGWGTWESTVAAGGITDESDLEIVAAGVLEAGAAPTTTYTLEAHSSDTRWLPLIDYDSGDIVLAPGMDGIPTPMQISTMALTVEDDTGVTINLAMGDQLTVAARVTAQRLKAASGGSVGGLTTGGAGVRPGSPKADVRRPAQTYITT